MLHSIKRTKKKTDKTWSHETIAATPTEPKYNCLGHKVSQWACNKGARSSREYKESERRTNWLQSQSRLHGLMIFTSHTVKRNNFQSGESDGHQPTHCWSPPSSSNVTTNKVELNKNNGRTRGNVRAKKPTTQQSDRNNAIRMGNRVECASAYNAKETQTMLMAATSQNFSILHNKHIIHDSIETCFTKLLLAAPSECIWSITEHELCTSVCRSVQWTADILKRNKRGARRSKRKIATANWI